MDEKKPQGNGFLVGLILGGAIGALVSTKKGRQLIKGVSEHGLDYLDQAIEKTDIGSILDQVQQEEIMMESEMKDEVVEEVPAVSRRKRLFKGIRKKG